MTDDMTGDAGRPFCTCSCPEGGPDGNRQHVWDLLQGMRGPVTRPGVAMNYNISAYEGPDSRGRLPQQRESVTLTRPKDVPDKLGGLLP